MITNRSTNKFTELSCRLEGEVISEPLLCQLLATDGSIYKKTPAAVVYPKNDQDVLAVVQFARRNGLSVHPRGAGSGLCGSALGSGVIIDFTRYMNRLIRIDVENQWFECQPGYRKGELEEALAGSGLFFPPDPSSGEYASFGGMYGTNASGAHSVKYGNVADYILDAQVVFSDGASFFISALEQNNPDDLPENFRSLWQLYQANANAIENAYPAMQCNVSGYNLRGLVKDHKLNLGRLFAGSEGSLGIVTRMKFRLAPKPAFDSLVVAYFNDIIDSAKAVQKIILLEPSGIEIMDKSLLSLARHNDVNLRGQIPSDVDNVLLIEFDADRAEDVLQQAETARSLMNKECCPKSVHLTATEAERDRFWGIRKAAVPILYKLKGDRKILALVEDAAIPIKKLPDYFKGIYRIFAQHNVKFVTYGHIAKGLMHTRPLLNLKNDSDVKLLPVLADKVFELVSSLKGTISGEHGDGRIRSAYINQQYPQIYPLFIKIKSLLDSANMLNPEIKSSFESSRINTDLRFGTAYKPQDLAFKELIWKNDYLDQVEKCHGCSKCTTVTTATRMCPIYKFTRDESTAPKAKANVLMALINGAVRGDAIYHDTFQSVMAKCVNCGSCYSECPSNVNIPKLVLEAKAQYVRKFGTNRHQRTVTSLENTARSAGKIMSVAQPLIASAPVKKVIEKWFGLSAQRKTVAISKHPLRQRISNLEGKEGKQILYFAGCYASYIRPEIGVSAVNIMNAIGYRVITPEQHCCGIPMLSKGMVDAARSRIEQNLAQLIDRLDRVEHLVVTCSSCGLSLMQEWPYVTENQALQQIQKKTIHISTLVNQHRQLLRFNRKPETIGYHQPCHLKVQPEAQSSLEMLNAIPGAEVKDLNSHCCGMAGSWGMAKENFELSRSIGTDLISKLSHPEVTTGATDCPTCRIQMEEFSHKKVLHPIEVLAACVELNPVLRRRLSQFLCG